MGFGEDVPELDHDLIAASMDVASQLGATYADVRVEAVEREGASAENGIIKTLAVTSGTSLGVRALAGGGWGFASFHVPEITLLGDRLREAVERAVSQAKATARFEEVKLAPSDPVVDDLPLDIGKEPWPLEGKQDEIVAITKEMNDIEGMALATGTLRHSLFDSMFASTEGARITRRHLITEGSYYVHAIGPDDAQGIWRPFGVTGGLDLLVGDNDPRDLGMRIANTAVELATEAKAPEDGKTDVITTPEFDQLLVHEIVGHPTEADRVLGGESAWAGRAWWSHKSGDVVGSELVNVVSDARPIERHAGGFGTFAYDDEGVPSQRVHHIVNGRLSEFLHSRQSAAQMMVEPNGGMRAITAAKVPIVRMTNTYFESNPEGPSTLEECIEDVKEGVILGESSIPSIDSVRLRWQINAYEGWRVENGEVVGRLKNLAFLGNTPEYFQTIRTVGNAKTWKLLPIPNCGKGDPMQIQRIGNGGPVMVGQGNIVGVA
jgi:TldD protein